MECPRLSFSSHALKRMFSRGISVSEVERVLQFGEVIENYPNDAPFPSCLLLANVDNRSLHVVVAKDIETGLCIIITVYVPDTVLWHEDFRNRRPK